VGTHQESEVEGSSFKFQSSRLESAARLAIIQCLAGRTSAWEQASQTRIMKA
jgi:hypothetical protein